MKRTFVVALVIVLAAFAAACRGQEDETSSTTGTISPVTPVPQQTGTDAVTTQTVDIGDSDRSPAEGAGSTAEPPPDTTGTTTRRP